MNLDDKIKSLSVTRTGRFVYRFLPYRRDIVIKNIEQVFGATISPEAKYHLAQSFYSHLMTSLKEGLMMRFKSEAYLKQWVDVEGVDHLLKVAEEQKGVLVLTGHFGNWEFAPIGGILNFKAYQGQFHFIRRTLKFKFLEKILFRRYYNAGLGVIPKKNSLTKVVEVLEQNHAVIFVMDQHASLVNRDGVAVEFFGKKAGTYRSLATIARYTNIPVIPAACYRKSDGRHVLKFYPPIGWTESSGTKSDIALNTRAYNQALEAIILEHPEQWMWLHRRWKLKSHEI